MTVPTLLPQPLLSSEGLINLPLISKGKVRETYDLGGNRLLVVTSDRLSAFDVIAGQPIRHKGAVLNHLTMFWLQGTAGQVPNHLIGPVSEQELRQWTDPSLSPEMMETLMHRCMVVRRAQPLPLECIVRGYITGSGWKDYQKTGEVCGIKLPVGLQNCSQLPDGPIFTPSTKNTTGHDENISGQQARDLVGDAIFERVENFSHYLYWEAATYARERGIIIADTKFEFGLIDGQVVLIDEVLTPDSSRFWPADQYQPGREQPSFDKQQVRNYLINLGWDKNPPMPELPPEVIRDTTERYIKAYELLTGKSFAF